MTTDPTKAQRSARTLIAGQRILTRRLTTRATAWVRAGRRTDLDGVAAILGCILRAVILGGAAYGAWWLVRRWPITLWAAVPLWLWAAIRAIPKDAPEAAEPDTPEPAPVEPLLDLLRAFIGIRTGVHLSTLLTHLQKHGQGEGWTVSDLKARLEACGVPVRRSVKVDGRVANGVHRDDVPAPSPAEGDQQAA
ncbi:hypothetical protein [Streptomyces sp. NPDC057509]|uniref:hypothetical protein n=1 Tax=Streptomyces sp. NPDC057509 TaxID=3346152 RepID=UPI0036A792C9